MNQTGFFEGTEMPVSGWWEALWPDPAGVLSKVGLLPDMSVVDLCSGDGWFTLPIARISHAVTAIDIDAKLLDTAKTRIAESGLENCEFIEGDAYEIATLIAVPADFVFLANALHGVPDKARLSRAVYSALRPRGLFAVVNWYARPREETTVLGEPRGSVSALRMAPGETVAAIEQSGLKLNRIVDVSPYHYGAVFART